MDVLFIFCIVIAALGLLVLFLVFPAVRRHPDRAMFDGKCIAHRGLHGGAENVPENSLQAFEIAAEKGYPIETDIHVTKDGRVAVFHDDDLKRMCGDERKPEELTLDELKAMKLAGTEQTIPSLEEVLALVHGRVPLLIEFKCTSLNVTKRLCEAAVPVLDGYEGKYAVQSFFPFVLRWYKKNRPKVMRGQLAEGFYKDAFPRQLAGALLFNALGRPDFVSYDRRNCRNVFFRLCTRLGAMPLGWTFRSKEELGKARKYYKGYIFENEETIR